MYDRKIGNISAGRIRIWIRINKFVYFYRVRMAEIVRRTIEPAVIKYKSNYARHIFDAFACRC